MEQTKKLGVIVGVNGDISTVGMYDMSNDSDIIWYGDVLSGTKVGSYLTILQNDIKIVAAVINEKILDQKNTIKSVEFDNRYQKNSINRVIQLKTRGVIKNGDFNVTSSYVPMIGNEISYTTKKDLNIIYGVDCPENSIEIGESILENQPVRIDINSFFASHIGIFGNTGSGKSNTLHMLYLELFNSRYREKIFEKSQFIVIDFNGEYVGNQFGVNENKKNFILSTRKKAFNKIPIDEKYIFDIDILSILFSATLATQKPFLKKVLSIFNELESNGGFEDVEIGLLEKLLTNIEDVNESSLDNFMEILKKYSKKKDYVINHRRITSKGNYEFKKIENNNSWVEEKKEYVNSGDKLNFNIREFLELNEIKNNLKNLWEANKCNPIKRLKMVMDFQRVYETSWGKTNDEFINPLFLRIKSSFDSLEKVIEVKANISESDFKGLNVISLVNTNQEVKRIIPMLISKMFYDIQKRKVAGNKVTRTTHLIVDEAHNILNSDIEIKGDTWKDYRLQVFEEIIKEGRKFGFFLTLSSQRPSDISPTIMSQLHNYAIHRLVNERDLKMLENTMPTLDETSHKMIPSLGKGEAVFTGKSIQVPIFVKVKKEENIRPDSDDVKLTELWD